ncbi:CynX/NimT family MFS transporter [Actinomycetospora sp. TBRC 11914]|uniref:MFS transporter n=1 Tax=Actinomycetospora sp. TBRC 11914 TaxID=2729387 RepID=UPI00145D617C|nr:MFS transporter [Actinomycetospora sp. TBRC 11914]NMO88644.1 MFS transporter [Actinomycetospora sp. TBRC 11914]
MTTSTGATRPAAASATGGSLLAVAVLLVALNLRGPIVAVAPVVDAIRTDLGVPAAVAGLLTSLPVLAFAVASSPASWLIGRIGPERAVLVGLAVLGAGTLLRSSDGVAGALGGTVLIGIGITVGNVVVPVIIGRDFPHRSGPLLGAYTAVMNIGSMITLSITVPLADGVGWRVALLAWLVVALAAAALWVVAVRRRPGGFGAVGRSVTDEREPDEHEPYEHEPAGRALPTGATTAERPPWRRPVGWLLVAAFAGQSFSYYGLTAWLPEILADLRGLGPASAGVASSLFQILAVAGALATPLVRTRTGSLRAAFVPVALGWLALPGGLLFAPALWPLWCALGGAAQGGGFFVFFSAVLAASRSTDGNRRLGAFMQTGGYAVGALGPTVVGALHGVGGVGAAWTAPLVLVLGALVALSASGWAATRARPT